MEEGGGVLWGGGVGGGEGGGAFGEAGRQHIDRGDHGVSRSCGSASGNFLALYIPFFGTLVIPTLSELFTLLFF